MKSYKPFNTFLMVAFFIVTIIYTSYSQEIFRTLGRYEYAKFDGVWYTIVEGNQGDLVDTVHIILRLKGKADISTFDFSQAALPVLENVRGRFADGFYEFKIPAKLDPFETAKKLVETDKFEYVFFNVFLRVDNSPNDPLYSNQWNLPKMVLSSAWNITTGSSSIIVAVIDVGGDHEHEDLLGNRWSGIGYNFFNNNSDPYPPDEARHGTAVAGILGAVTNNGLGVAGVAGGWGGNGGIRIMHLRAGYRDNNGNEWISLSAAAQATDSAASWGARVINMSFGGDSYPALENAINRAVDDSGVVVVASAGNYRSGQSTSIIYPARYSNVIAVGATTPNDTRKEINDGTENWWGSCYGPELDVVAPGVYIRTTDLTGTVGYSTGNYYDSFNGTSSAAPMVAGLAALIRSFDPNLTWEQVRYLIRNSADKVSGMGGQNFTNEYGYGRINANKAVRNLYVPQIYSTIQQAFNKAVSGQNIIVSSGAYTVNTNLSVQNGINFIINPGAVLTFNAANKISVWGGGTFTANGATFQGNGTPGYWHSISYFSNSSGSIQNSTIKDAQCGIYTNNASINISNNTITNNSIYGLSILQNSNAPVSNCVISNNGTGINLYSSDITITGNNILNNTNYGINANNVSNNYIYWHSNNLHGNGYAMLLNNASPWIGHSNFSDNAHGVVMTSSLASFAVVPNLDERMRGYNVIACNTATPNFKADNYSSVYAGYGYDGGYNSIYGSELPDMESRNNSGIYASNNYWGSPYPAIYADGTSWILAWYPLNEDPNPSCYNKSSSSFANTEVIEGDFSNVFWEAISEGRRGNLQRAKELLLSIVNGKYNSKYSPLALLAFYDFITNTSSRDSINTGLNTVLTGVYDRTKSDSLRPFAVRLLARENALSNNLNKMISFNNEIIDNYQNSVNELTALYDLITYYSVIESDTIKAQTLFARMLNNYPEEDLTKFAAINLGYNFENLKKNVSSEENPASYELSNAYPNPFNPSTMISYSLRDEGRVSLKVYDILGSEVATLVNETKPAGTYEVEFNASNLPSGVYIYRMSVGSSAKAGGFTASKKMLLVK